MHKSDGTASLSLIALVGVAFAAGCAPPGSIVRSVASEDGLHAVLEVDRQAMLYRIAVTNASAAPILISRDMFQITGLPRAGIRCRTVDTHVVYGKVNSGVGEGGWWSPKRLSAQMAPGPVTLPLAPGDTLRYEAPVTELRYLDFLGFEEFLRSHEFQIRIDLFYDNPERLKWLELQTPWVRAMSAKTP